MKPEQAAELGQRALIFLAGEPDALGGFLAASGADASELRARAADPEFLGFVLDYLLQSDALVLAFAQDARMAPELVARARGALPGGYAPDWT